MRIRRKKIQTRAGRVKRTLTDRDAGNPAPPAAESKLTRTPKRPASPRRASRATPNPASALRRVQRKLATATEELRRRREADALRAATEARLRLAVEAANIGFWDWDIRNNTVYHSPEWKRQLGYADHEVTNAIDEWQSRLHPDDQARVRAVVDDFFQRPRPGYDLEFRLRHRDGSYRWIHSQGHLVSEQGRPVRLIGVHLDITATKVREAELQESEQRFRRLVESTPVIPWEADARSQQFTYVGPRAPNILGYPLEDWFKDGFWRNHLHPGDMAEALAARRQLMQGRDEFELEYRMLAADGRVVWFHDVVHVVRGSAGIEKLEGFSLDITERKQLEAEVLEISEREQQRIARDLHDSLGQLLTGVLHMANTLQLELADHALPEAGTALRVVELLNQALTEARSLAQGLSPVGPDRYGLISALRELGARTEELFQVRCPVYCRRTAVADTGLATHLYRIAQEAITNALKHGQAKRIELALRSRNDRIILSVRDNGLGFGKGPPTGKGLGIRIMQYRAGMIGGALTIGRGIGRGARIVCRVHRPVKT